MSMISETRPDEDQPARRGLAERVLRAVLRRLNLSSESMGLLWRLVRESFPNHARGYGLAIAAMIVMAATTALMAWIMRDVTDQFVIAKDADRIVAIALFIAAIFIIKGAATFVQSYTLSRVGNAIIAERQRILYDRLIRQGLDFFNRLTSSELIMRFTQGAQAARNVLDILVTSFVRDMFTLAGLVIVMVVQQPLLSLIVLVVGPVAIYGISRLVKRVRSIMTLELQSISRIIQVLQETSRGARIIKSFDLDERMRGYMHDAIEDVRKRSNKIARLQSTTSPIMETLAGLAIAGVIIVGARTVAGDGKSPGELMSFITAVLLAYEPAKRLARMRVSIESGLVGVRLMYGLIDQPLSLIENSAARQLEVTRGEIEFDNVSFGYNEDHRVMENFSVVFPAGKMSALVGPSGGGKSTMINLIMRLYDPDEGAVRIDGQNLADTTFKSIRESMAYVSQDTFLFSGTILDNIRLGRENATEEEVIEAAKAACAHDFIMAFPKGYLTDIGEDGSRLSGGQKQRIAIARAILRDARILLLDEATSALDAESEAQIRLALMNAAAGRTTIAIAHRLSTVCSADAIFVIDNGRVVEQGTHDELRRSGGLYNSLCDHQLV